MVEARRRRQSGRGYSAFSRWPCGFVLLLGACAGDRPTFPDLKSVNAAEPDSPDGAIVERRDSGVAPSSSTVEPSTSSAEPSSSTTEPSTVTVEPNVSPGSGNDGPDPAATDECPDGCFIAGTCYSPGDLNPSNACTACDPDSSNSQWSNVDGETCDDGLYCTVGDRCSAGKCEGDERACDDGVACNGAETCDETQEACASAESACDEGQTCDVENDECSSTCNGCVIDGSCYSDGAVSPSNPCMVCDLSTSINDWILEKASWPKTRRRTSRTGEGMRTG